MPRRDPSPEPWRPSHPAQAADGRDPYAPREAGAEDRPAPGLPWGPAPPGSHLHGRKSLTDSFTRKFVARSYGFADGSCVRMVAFRAAGRQPFKEYAYAFPTPEACDGWADAHRSGGRPGEHTPATREACSKYKRVR